MYMVVIMLDIFQIVEDAIESSLRAYRYGVDQSFGICQKYKMSSNATFEIALPDA